MEAPLGTGCTYYEGLPVSVRNLTMDAVVLQY